MWNFFYIFVDTEDYHKYQPEKIIKPQPLYRGISFCFAF